MRLFIALNFSEDTLHKLAKLGRTIKTHASGARLTPVENLHLTLLFLGECSETQSLSVISALDSLSFVPFYLEINSLGKFARPGGDLYWAGVKENSQLSKLHMQIKSKLLAAGFKLDPGLETKAFKAHISLARRVIGGPEPSKIEAFGENVDSIYLMKSQQRGRQMSYTVLYKKDARSNTDIDNHKGANHADHQ